MLAHFQILHASYPDLKRKDTAKIDRKKERKKERKTERQKEGKQEEKFIKRRK